MRDVSVQGDRKGPGPVFRDVAQLTAVQLNSLPPSSNCQIVPGPQALPPAIPQGGRFGRVADGQGQNSARTHAVRG